MSGSWGEFAFEALCRRFDVFLHNYSAEYEYTIRPTMRTEQNTNRIFGTALFTILLNSHQCGALLGTPLHELDLEGATLSEVLRLHLLSSGARRLPGQLRSDFQQRGGYTPRDNPALDFCQSESSIVDSLAVSSVFQLSPGIHMQGFHFLENPGMSGRSVFDWNVGAFCCLAGNFLQSNTVCICN